MYIPLTQATVDHCLELLRQAVMCRADTSLITFEWNPSERRPMLQLRGKQHQCDDWEEVQAKLKSRAVKKEEMARLRNPLFADDEVQ